MFLKRSLRNFESNIKFSFLAVRKDIDSLHKVLENRKNDIVENKNNLEILRKSTDIFKEDTEDALNALNKVINNLKEDYNEQIDGLKKELTETKNLIEVKSAEIREIKSGIKLEIKNITKKINNIEDNVKVLKPQEELSVEKIFKEETNKEVWKIVAAVIGSIIILAIIGYGIYALF